MSNIDIGTLQEAAFVLQTYSMGVNRIPLEDMGCWDKNRNGLGVNPPHVHTLMKRVHKEGLVRFRYGHGMALCPPPEDQLRFAVFTNNYVAQSPEALSRVAMKCLYGSFAKTHLWHGLWTMKCGDKKWEGTNLPLSPGLADDPELVETFKHGMFYERLPYLAYERHPEAVLALMTGDNLDAVCAMREHEFGVLLCFWNATFLEPPDILKQQWECEGGASKLHTEWEAVNSAVTAKIGDAWSEDEKKRCFNLAKGLGEDHLQMLLACHKKKDPKVFFICTSTFQAVSKLPMDTPWLKVCIVVANILAGVKGSELVPGLDRVQGNSVPNKVIHLVQALPRHALQRLEKLLQKVLDNYNWDKVHGVDSSAFLNARLSFLKKAGDGSKRFWQENGPTTEVNAEKNENEHKPLSNADSFDIRLARGETALRNIMQESRLGVVLPPRILEEPPAKQEKQSKNFTQVDLMPAVNMKDGKVIHDFAYAVWSRNLTTGKVVYVLPDGDEAQILRACALSETVTVEFKTKKDENGALMQTAVGLEHLLLKPPPPTTPAPTEVEAKAASEAGKASHPPPSDGRGPGKTWAPASAEERVQGVKTLISDALLHTAKASSPTMTEVRLHDEVDNLWCPDTLSMEKKVGRHALVILPHGFVWAAGFEDGTPLAKRRRMDPSAVADAQEPTEEERPVQKVALRDGSVIVVVDTTHKMTRVEVIGGKVLRNRLTSAHDSLFSRLVRDHQVPEPQATLEIFEVKISCAPAVTTNCWALKGLGKKEEVSFTIPAFRNKQDLAIGSVLTVPRIPEVDSGVRFVHGLPGSASG